MSAKKLFKYLDVSGVKAVLENGTLLFSSPLYFNDPFDISIQSLFAYDPYDFDALLDALVTFTASDEALGAGNGSDTAKKFALIRSAFAGASLEQQKDLRKELFPKEIWEDPEGVRQSGEATHLQIKTAFETSGVFCASKRFDNYLLWAHYAEKHHGAVIEFVPNLEKDSLLRLAEDVQYSSMRPHLYESHKDYLTKALLRTADDVLRDYTKRITMTKSEEWAYEEELRIYVPTCVNIFQGKRHHIHSYHDNELRKVYLGCKMNQANRLNVIDLAIRRNPDVEIYEMVAKPHQYQLEAKRIR